MQWTLVRSSAQATDRGSRKNADEVCKPRQKPGPRRTTDGNAFRDAKNVRSRSTWPRAVFIQLQATRRDR
jgi:hypothetical protein